MVLDAEFLVVGIGRNVEHVFEPIIAVGNLDFVPIRVLILEAALPIEAEPEQIDEEAVFGGEIPDYEAGMKKPCADLVGRSLVVDRYDWALDEGKRISLGVAKLEMLGAVALPGDLAGGHTVRQEIAAHLLGIVGGECDFSEPTLRSWREYNFQFDLLLRRDVDRKARAAIAGTTTASRWKTKNLGVEVGRLVHAGDVHANVVDAGDFRTAGLLLGNEGSTHKSQDSE